MDRAGTRAVDVRRARARRRARRARRTTTTATASPTSSRSRRRRDRMARPLLVRRRRQAALMLLLLAAMDEGLAAGRVRLSSVPENGDVCKDLLGMPDDVWDRRRRHDRQGEAGRRTRAARRSRIVRQRRRPLDEVVHWERWSSASPPRGSARRSTSTRRASGASTARRPTSRSARRRADPARRRSRRVPRRARLGIPFTSERQLTGSGPAEATATIVHRVLRELGLEERRAALERRADAPRHGDLSNRRPTRLEVEAALPFACELSRGRRVLAVGRVAEAALGAPYVRHPSRGGAVAFRETLRACLT